MSFRYSGVIADQNGYMVESWGNGAAYLFTNQLCQQSVWIQDEEAERFRGDFDQVMEMDGGAVSDSPLAWLWDQCGWGELAQDREPVTGRSWEDLARNG